MKFIRLECGASREELLSMIKDHESVNKGVKFDENRGKPIIKVKEKGERLRIKCEMVGGPSRDNGFLEGTCFFGKLTERDGVCRLRGVILTAPIYHLIIAAILLVYVLRSISLKAFNPVPILLLAFSMILFRFEFEKQGIIERYLKRAVRRMSDSKDVAR